MMVEIKGQNYYFLSIYKGEIKIGYLYFLKYHGSDLAFLRYCVDLNVVLQNNLAVVIIFKN